MAYNLTNMTSAVYGYELVGFANEVTGGIFMSGFVITLFIVMLMIQSIRKDFIESLLVSSWVLFVLSSFLSFMGQLNPVYPLIFVLLTAFSAFFKLFSSTA